jgi:hypothetical protein
MTLTIKAAAATAGREMRTSSTVSAGRLLRPIDIKRQARVPYRTVIAWLETGHPRAGILPSVNLAPTAKRKSYRVRPDDWEAFLARLRTEPRTRQPATPTARPPSRGGSNGLFRY